MILLIDDDEQSLEIASNVLDELYDVICINDAQNAFEAAKLKNPDLILMDLNMPGVSGFDLFKEFAADSKVSKIPVIFLTADNSVESEIVGLELGAVDFIIKPFVPPIMLKRIKRAILMSDYQQNLESLVKEKIAEISRLHQELIESMANLIESRDSDTGEHVKRTSACVQIVANSLRSEPYYNARLSDSMIENIVEMAPMHDIGKITISDAILQKPGRLTKEEFDIMKSHTTEGKKIIIRDLAKIETPERLEIAANIAEFHHEKWNGEGYPMGLEGEDIPLCARIMAIADVFDALVSKRCYKDAMTFDQAFKIIEESTGSHFDPIIGKVFLEQKDQIIELYSNEL